MGHWILFIEVFKLNLGIYYLVLKGIFMKLEEFKVYNLSMEIGERIWSIVITWDYFAKETIGRQMVKAADSVAANLSEGFGRYHYKESVHFSYYSRGSLYETKTWITKSHSRKLITDSDYKILISDIENISVRLNNYIKSIGKTRSVST